MTTNDPIADMLTRVRNANTTKYDVVDVPASKMKVTVVDILVNEGHVGKYEFVGNKGFQDICITLKYGATKNGRIFNGLKRISKPGPRTYVGKEDMPKVFGGPSTAVISANRGVVTDKEARRLGVGGGVLAFI